MKRITKPLAALVFAVGFLSQCPTLALANSIPALTVSGGSTFIWSRTLGWAFSTSSQLSVTSLGVYDSGLNGLESAVDVGIWRTSDQALLGSTTILAGTGSGLVGNFRYESTPSFVLDAGTEYRIGAVALTGAIPFLHEGNAILAPELTLIGNGVEESASNNVLTFPNQIYTPNPAADRYFGPNFQFASAVPEPGSFTLLAAGLGMTGLAGWRRRRKQSQSSDH